MYVKCLTATFTSHNIEVLSATAAFLNVLLKFCFFSFFRLTFCHDSVTVEHNLFTSNTFSLFQGGFKARLLSPTF